MTFELVIVPSGTDLTRFALFDADTDGNDDLDLYIFGPAASRYSWLLCSRALRFLKS
ncbi:MAG: hypothetical protein IIB75_10625 [Proteobacteria bacterium]|nr:hypothetical protein [Pseudomonadota bacterium]